MKNNYWFTFVELLVWISISTILMLSVSLFVWSWISNIAKESVMLENSSDFSDFTLSIQNSFDYSRSWSYINRLSPSEILFKRWPYFDKWGFTYIWVKEDYDKFYCLSWSEDTMTDHAIVKTFVPFEEQGEDIFSDYNSVFTATSWWFTSYALEHVVKQWANIIIWKWVFWSDFVSWDPGDSVYLNNPTGLAQIGNTLFVSDTLNNRVLYYDIPSKRVYKLLDEWDWLLEPTGLYINSWKLYIANSWRWEILEFSSDAIWTPPVLTMTWFTSNVNEIHISFSWTQDPSLSNNWTFNIAWHTANPDHIVRSWNLLKYFFVTKNPESNQASCIWTEIKTNAFWKPIIYCTKAWSGQTTNFPTDNISQIEVSNLNWFWSSWNYFANLKLYNWPALVFEKYFPYFVVWDNDLLTLDDNILRVYSSWLNYPTWIWGVWPSDFNEFLWWSIDFSTSSFNEVSDDILDPPLESLEFDLNSWQLSMVLKYYKIYNCYDLEEKASRTYLYKKNF